MKYFFVIFVFLALGTVLSHKWIDQYEAAGPDMLTDQWQVRSETDCRGRFELKDIHLVPVIERPAYIGTQKVVLFLWAVFGLVFISAFFVRTRKSTLLKVVLGLAFAGIIIGTTMPVGIKNKIIKEVKAVAEFVEETIVPTDKQKILWQPDKIGHFCFFAMFGFILICMLEQDAGFTALVYILMVAAGTELVQIYIDGRSGCLSDFLIDAAGGCLGITISVLGQSLKNKRIKKG